MKVRSKVSIFAVLLVAIPLFTVAMILGWLSYSTAQEAMQAQLNSSLISRREAKKSEVEAYFNTVYGQLISQASSAMIVDAAKEFDAAYVASDSKLTSEANDSLNRFYKEDFTNKYIKKNNGSRPDVSSITGALSEKTKWFQYLFISNNPANLGEKDGMLSSELDPGYDAVHQRYHPSFRAFLQQFGFYDVFIVEPNNGNVVYSVYKELDFATSLTEGPYRDSGLAKAYRNALASDDSSNASAVDFSAFMPSYNDNAAFLSAPIMSNGEIVGVLVFQMALEKINSLMTLGGKWQEAGFGETGEVYLVGTDGVMRSDSRLFVENTSEFDSWAQKALGAQTAEKIRSQGTTIGALPVNTEASRAVVSGKTGIDSYVGYLGESVIGAYSPLAIQGFNWGIITEIGQEEGFAAVEKIKGSTMLYSSVTLVIALIIASGAGIWFAAGISAPISNLSETVARIAQENDLTIQVQESGDDEIVNAAASVNRLVSRLNDNFSSIGKSSLELADSASNLSGMMMENLDEIEKQNMECQKVAQSAGEMEVAATEVARNASETANQTRAANELAGELGSLVKSSVNSTNKVAGEIESANTALETLAAKSANIGSVLDVIQAIAEQTNLLALNAAIEAARAGEQGRGFAVVAEEVRNLAQRTQGATGEISTMIEALQAESESAVAAMKSGLTQVQTNVEQANSSQQALNSTVDTISSISNMNDQVATAAEQQSAVVKEITRSTNDLKVLSERSSERTTELNNISSSLRDLSGNLNSMVGEYKV